MFNQEPNAKKETLAYRGKAIDKLTHEELLEAFKDISSRYIDVQSRPAPEPPKRPQGRYISEDDTTGGRTEVRATFAGSMGIAIVYLVVFLSAAIWIDSCSCDGRVTKTVRNSLTGTEAVNVDHPKP